MYVRLGAAGRCRLSSFGDRRRFVRCVLERMIMHHAGNIPKIVSLSNDNSRPKQHEIFAEAGADLASIILHVVRQSVEVATKTGNKHELRVSIS